LVINVKGLVHPKVEILRHLLIIMLFQTKKCTLLFYFIYLFIFNVPQKRESHMDFEWHDDE